MKMFFATGGPSCAGGCGGTGRVTKNVTFADGSKGPILVPCICEQTAEATVEMTRKRKLPSGDEVRVWRGEIVVKEDTTPADVLDYEKKQEEIDAATGK